MFMQKLPHSYLALGSDFILARRLLDIRSDSFGLTAPVGIDGERIADHGDACFCLACLPPGPERRRIMVEHLHDHNAEVEAEERTVRS